MSSILRLISGVIFCSIAAGQVAGPDRVTLPAGKTEAEFTVPLQPGPGKGATVTVLPITDANGKPLEFPPTVAEPVLTGDDLALKLSDVFFWGQARLQVDVSPGGRRQYVLRRGPSLASADLTVERGNRGQIWLYNFETQPLNVRWRMVSGTEWVCGIESDGTARQDCVGVPTWASATLRPAGSDSFSFALPDAWFNRWKTFGDDTRKARLELCFGTDGSAPVRVFPVELHLKADAFEWLFTAWDTVQHLLWVTFSVTLGAVLLMLAQVMIPNFRQCLRMEGEIEGLQDRLRAISSHVGDRLYTRCQRELESVKVALAMGQAAKGGVLSWDRIALAGNTGEVSRIASVLPRIESRIRLTERLDEIQTGGEDADPANVPPSFCWNRATELKNVQAILSRQFITEADEKNAAESLDLLMNDLAAMKGIVVDLDARIAGLRRLLNSGKWKEKYPPLIEGLTGCAELVQGEPQPVPDGGWSTEETIIRDRSASRLEIVVEMISLAALLEANPEVKGGVLKKLQSNDPFQLADAREDLRMLSEGVAERDVEAALKAGLWDTYFEPGTVTDQDVLRVSLVFRNKDVDRSTAKERFQCYWRIGTDDGSGADSEVYESGWEAQLISQRGNITVSAQVYDRNGNEVAIRPDTEEGKKKGVFSFEVGPTPAGTLRARLLRGLLDATITAVVPVITVAITQVQNGGAVTMDKLILLGFTSQAIRAAVVPDSETAGAAAKSGS